MPTPVIQRAFSSGEVAPAFGARADLVRYTTGAKTLRNFLVRQEGGAANRPGTEFVTEVKTSASRTYLLPYVFGEQGYVVEVGNTYMRFAVNGAVIEISPGTPYEISTPYLTADLARLQWEQSGDVLTIVHPSYVPRELRRVSDTSWTLTTITTEPSVAAPSTPTVTGMRAGGHYRRYVVTSIKADTYEESVASNEVSTGACEDPTSENPLEVSWSPVAGAVEYGVYCAPYGNVTEAGGVFGAIGRSQPGETVFRDPGFLPDFLQTPPVARTLFASSGNYPSVVGYYQQRRLFAGSTLEPEKVYASRIGFPSNFAISSPLQDDDAVTWVGASRDFQAVRHLIDLKRLLVLTGAGEFKIQGDGASGALLPNAVNPDRQGYSGAAAVRPGVIGQTVLFVQARGARLREIRFTQELDGLGSRDLTLASPHLFRRKTLTRMAVALEPDPIVWALRSDGTLLGLTYVPDADVYAWHRHDTGNGDVFEDVVVVPEGNEDAVYVVVQRTIDGDPVRYLERFASRQIESVTTDAWFVDCGLAYSGTPIVNVTGLDHLEGRTVAVLADGSVPTGSFVVTGGAITLPVAASRIRVGLPITYQLESLDLDVAGSDVRDRRKRVPGVTLLVEGSRRGCQVGPDASHLTPVRAESWDTSTTVDGAFETKIATTWSGSGRVFLQHTDPTPLTVLGIVPLVEIGG